MELVKKKQKKLLENINKLKIIFKNNIIFKY